MLKVNNLYCSVTNNNIAKPILNDISISLSNGETLVITGANGSGKSTLLKTIMGILPNSAGQILLNKQDISKDDITTRARKGIAYAFQTPVRFKGVKVKDMLTIANNSKKIMDVCNYLSKVGLCAREYLDRELDGSLSGGEIKRIEVATTLARGAVINLFDEPEAGIDIWSMDGLIKCFVESKKKKSINIIVSHQEKILNIADKILVLDGGKVSAFGKAEDILPSLKYDQRLCGRIQSEVNNDR